MSDVVAQSPTWPTGTVTFLLTDLEKPSRQSEEIPPAIAAAVARRDELLAASIFGNGGVRPTQHGQGDGVVGAFSRASDAVAAALAAQQALGVEPWPAGAELRVRMAVHTGEAQLYDRTRYLGHALSRAARIRRMVHGGQVLVSEATAALVADHLPDGATLADLGAHRLTEVGRPERLWQLMHADLRAVFPAVRSYDVIRHNLPVQLTPLIGREREIEDLTRLVREERLVTLTGSAGVGKTRLALAAAAAVLHHLPGGAWWVELAPLGDPGAIGRTALAALGAREASGARAVHQLADALGDQASLLILDNCEHVVADCAALVAALLAANPQVSVLSTSREPLRVSGENTWRVPSMRCPAVDEDVDVPTMLQYDAVALFVERARRARPGFAVYETSRSAIAQICNRLDGIPLALELAAARCRQMSPERIAGDLDDRFRLLTGGARNALARQRTLRASIDWSHERLDRAEQTTLRRLGAFVGPFPLEAAEAVVASPGDVSSALVFDLISSLVDKSLVMVDEGSRGEIRYRLLETLRAYAVERARDADEWAEVRDAHAAWWAKWLEPRGEMPTDALLEEIADFHADLAAALDWGSHQLHLGLRLLRSVAVAWVALGRSGDAIAAADRLLTDGGAERHHAEWLAAAVVADDLFFEARGHERPPGFHDRVQAVAERLGDEFYLARSRWLRHTPGAAAELADLARTRGDRYVEAWSTIALATELAEHEPSTAEGSLRRADAVAAASGMRSLQDAAHLARVEAASSEGDLTRTVLLAAPLIHSSSSAIWTEAIRALSFATLLTRDEESLGVGVQSASRALRRSPGPAAWIATARHRLELLQGQPSALPRLLDEANRHQSTSSGTLWLVGREGVDARAADRAVDSVRALARPTAHHQAVLACVEALAIGDEHRWHDALAIALSQGLRLIAVDALEGIGVAAARAECWTECLRLLAAAERLRHETGYRWRFSSEQRALDKARADSLAALGDRAKAATAEGHGLDWRDAGAYARRARGERRRPNHGWASLTPTEHQVVLLVAAGLTNPQIATRLLMGPATVKTHVAHVFTKLGLHTRAALAAEVARRTSK